MMKAMTSGELRKRGNRRLAGLGSFLLVLVAAAACGSGSTVTADNGCREPLTKCVSACVDTNTDAKHCGACGDACEADQICSEGMCCAEEQTACDGACVDTTTAAEHCGECGNACDSNEVCDDGACEACPEGTSACSGSCVTLDDDRAHCGECNNVCGDDELCEDGSCDIVCFGGSVLCGDRCVDTDVDPDNCGACGEACGAEEVCSVGECAEMCVGGTTECDGGCVDTDLDPDNCGMCGSECESGQVCSQGECGLECSGGSIRCGDSCVDTGVDRSHCGACDNACESGEVCSAGECALECSGGSTRCGNSCVDTDVDRAHCGACDNGCDPGEVCSEGECGLECSGGTTLCDDECVDTDVDRAHCGACDNGCDPGEVCSEGECGLECSGGTTLCGDECVDTDVDRAHCGVCDNECDPGEVCSEGECGLECSGGTTLCDDECVDTNIDPAHCGACDNTCAVTEECNAGECATAVLQFDSITPNSGYYPGGLQVTIRGDGFDSATITTIGGEPCTLTNLVSGTQLRCLAPAGEVGSADVVVTRGDDSATGTAAFSYAPFTRVDTIAGTGTPGDVDGSGDVAQLSGSINGLQVVGTTLYVADGTNYKVRSIDLSGLNTADVQATDVTVATLAGSGVLGMADSSDGTGATAQFQQPEDLGFVSGNFIHVTDTDWVNFPLGQSKVRQVDLTTGETATVLGDADGYAALSDSAPFVYLSECGTHNVIRRWEMGTTTYTDFAGSDGMFGDVDGVGTAARLACPYGMTMDAAKQNIYFTDWGNHKIKRVALSTRSVSTVAGTGSAGFSDGDALTVARFAYPNKLSIAARHIFIGDMDKCAVREFDMETSQVATIAGSPDICSASDGPVASASFGGVVAVFYAPAYGIFVGSGDWGWRGNPFGAAVRLIH